MRKVHVDFFRRALAVGLLFASPLGVLVACEGCRTANGNSTKSPPGTEGVPTVRLYFVSDLAGAVEPCGCVKDQLGGLDHLGAWIAAERPKAPVSGLLAAGPLFYMDPELRADKRAQDMAKAGVLATSLRGLGFVAFAPGKNDWAGGEGDLQQLRSSSGGAMVLGNVDAQGKNWEGWTVKEMNGVKVGLIGVSALDQPLEGPPVPGASVTPAADAVRAGVTALEKQGVKIIIVLAAIGRGEAKRLADQFPRLTAILVGSPGGAGDQNTTAGAPERVGDVLIVQTSNHLQTAAALDLFVRGDSTTFADATGIGPARKREELTTRIDELHVRISAWDREGRVAKADIDARRADLAKLEAERDALDKQPAPETGSFFRIVVKEMRDSVGSDPAVKAQLATYYKKINEENKIAFAGRKPAAPDPKEPAYVGVEACSRCHDEARAVWDKTRHSHAYETLAKEFKEYNLDCVGCHVTGYDRPGGSTVTFVDRLKDVQCEVCHGPGSKHAAAPRTVKPPIAAPDALTCTSSCHHAPHVLGFDAAARMKDILGRGHGKKR